jgi:hypothetical protein
VPQAAAFDPSQPFTPVAAFDPSKPFTPADEPTPDFRATNEPPSAWLKATAYGKDAASLALDALPGAGAVIGGVLATPETLGGGTLAGAALGAGAGKGARDFLKAAFGFERPTTALDEAGRIARDTAETYVVGKILPALWEGIKNPKATVGDVYGEMANLYKGLPKAVKAFLPDIEAYRASLPAPVAKAPAAILQRPAWQGWDVPEHLDRSVPIPPSALTQEQIAERVFGGQGTPSPAVEKPPLGRVRGVIDALPPDVAPVRPAAAALDVPAPPVATGDPAVAPPSPPGSAGPAPPVTNTLPDQRALNEAALAARRAAYQARVQAAAEADAAAQSPAPARIKLTAPESKEYLRLRQGGMTDPQAVEALQAARAFQARFGTPTPTVAETTFPKR